MNKLIFKIFLLVLTLYSLGCSRKEQPKEEVLRPVKYMVVGSNNLNQVRTFSGNAKAGNEIELSFRESGVIQNINVSKGDRVKKGQLIARLDNIEANLDFERAITEVNRTESAMNTAKAELDRVKLLYEKGSTPLKEYQSAQDRYQNALSQFEAAKRNREIKRSRLNYGLIYSPSDGIIANTIGKVNERVQTGHVFAILNAGEQIKVGLDIPENTINELTLGLNATIQFSTLGEEVFTGTVVEISPIPASGAATYPVDVEVSNPTEKIRPGMAASVTFEFGSGNESKAQGIVVPITAVGEDAQGNYVFLVETEDRKTGIAKKQTVEVGDFTANGFEITSGLNAGQLIATAGLQTLLDGQKVKLD
jgi:RND family efflux transporter MFP subunit